MSKKEKVKKKVAEPKSWKQQIMALLEEKKKEIAEENKINSFIQQSSNSLLGGYSPQINWWNSPQINWSKPNWTIKQPDYTYQPAPPMHYVNPQPWINTVDYTFKSGISTNLDDLFIDPSYARKFMPSKNGVFFPCE